MTDRENEIMRRLNAVDTDELTADDLCIWLINKLAERELEAVTLVRLPWNHKHNAKISVCHTMEKEEGCASMIGKAIVAMRDKAVDHPEIHEILQTYWNYREE